MEFFGNHNIIKSLNENGKHFFSIVNKKAIDIHLVLVWQVHLTNPMLFQVFPPLPKHQHCKVSCGIINWGIYMMMGSMGR